MINTTLLVTFMVLHDLKLLEGSRDHWNLPTIFMAQLSASQLEEIIQRPPDNQNQFDHPPWWVTIQEFNLSLCNDEKWFWMKTYTIISIWECGRFYLLGRIARSFISRRDRLSNPWRSIQSKIEHMKTEGLKHDQHVHSSMITYDHDSFVAPS